MDVAAVSSLNNPNKVEILEEPTGNGQIDSDFETFLSLLTAQLQNQDPLQPIDSTQFVAQLAQFSSVEQQVATNDALSEILTALQGDGPASLGQWIGREVETQASLPFNGDLVHLTTAPISEARTATLVVTDQRGTAIAAVPVDPVASELTWDGTSASGNTAEPGFYRFTVKRSTGDAPLPDDIPRGFVKVSEVRLIDGAPMLVLEGGESRLPREISALREPSP